jgi:hypothetical protein
MNAQAVSIENALRSAMTERRNLESELATIDGKIRDSILNADAKRMTELQQRKKDLPTLYIRASHHERELSNRIHGQARTDAEQALAEATANHEEEKASFERLQERHRVELEEASRALRESETAKNTAQSGFLKANEALTRSQQGCKAALGRVAGMF